MGGVYDPTKAFGKSMWNRENTRNMVHDNIFGVGPVLNGKKCCMSVLQDRWFSGDMVIDHVDKKHVVFIEQ